MKIISLFQKLEYAGIAYVVPVAMGNNTCKTNDWRSICIFNKYDFSVCGSIMFNEGVTSTLNYSVGIYVLLSSLSVSIFLREKSPYDDLTSWYTRFYLKCSLGGVIIITQWEFFTS